MDMHGHVIEIFACLTFNTEYVPWAWHMLHSESRRETPAFRLVICRQKRAWNWESIKENWVNSMYTFRLCLTTSLVINVFAKALISKNYREKLWVPWNSYTKAYELAFWTFVMFALLNWHEITYHHFMLTWAVHYISQFAIELLAYSVIVTY